MSGAVKSMTLELIAKNSSVKAVFAESEGVVRRFGKTVDGTNKSLISGANIAKTAAVGITALAAGLSYAVSKAVAFDKAMRNVNSLTKANEQTFAAMEKQVISMSTKLPQSATTLAEGLYDIASSGFQGADGIKVLDAAARSASAGLTTTAVSSRAITGVLNAYGLKAKDAADVSDVLFSTVNLGVISFDELANNLGDVVGSAAAASVGIDEVGAAIATMTLSGIKGAQATTSLNDLMKSLVKPSTAMTTLFKQLGYESGASALKQKGLQGVMEDIRKATGGNITTMLQLFPNIEAARGALALLANNGANYAKVADQITDKTKRMGSTQAVLDEQMKSVSAQWQLFTNRIDAAATTVGVKLLPYLSQAMVLTQSTGQAIAKFAGELKDRVGPGLDQFGQAGGHVVDLLENLGKMVLTAGEGLAKLGLAGAIEAFNQLGGVLETVTGFAADNQQIILLLGLAYAAQATGGVALLYGALGKAADAFGMVGPAASKAYDFVAGLFTPGVAGAADSVTMLGDKAKAAGSKMKAAFMAVAPAAAIGGVLAVAISAWSSYSDGVREAKDATKDVERAMNTFDVDQLAAAVNRAEGFIADYYDRLDTFNRGGKGPGFDQLINFTENYKTTGMLSQLDRVQEKADQAKEALSQMQYNTTELFKLMGKPLPDEAKWINDVQGANGVQAQTIAMNQMKAVLDQLGPALKAAGVDVTKGWDTQQFTNASSAIQKVRDSTRDTAGAQTTLIDAIKGSSDQLTTAADAADSLKKALDDLMGASIGVAQAQIDWASGLDKLKTTLRDNGATLSFNTTKGRENNQAIIDQVGNLQDILVASANAGAGQEELAGKLEAGRSALIKAGTAAGFSKGEMVKLLAQYNLTPELVATIIKESGAQSTKEKLKALADQAAALDKLKPKPKVSAETTNAQNRLNAVQNRLDEIDGRTANASVTVTENTYKNMIETTTHLDKGVRVNADGGYYPTTRIPSYANGKLPGQATIAPGRGGGMVQWAEAETGGEAFIPLGPSKRVQSEKILGKVAESFGYMLVQSYASGGFHFPPFKFDPKGGPRVTQFRDWEDRRYAAQEEYKSRQLLAQTAAGRAGEGVFRGGMDVSSTFGNLGTSLEARGQAAAELAAQKSRNPSDDAADFYKKTDASLAQYIQSLKTATVYQRQWNRTLTDLSGKVGADVVNQLAAMGEQGEAVIKQMAKGTITDMKYLANQIRAMNFTKFVTDTQNDVRGRAAFQANLQALIKMGRGDLAARFEQMGYDSAAGLAAQAVKSPGSVLTGLNNSLSAQEQLNDPAMGDAFKLMQLIAQSGGKLGVIGLSQKSGMAVGDVLGLLTRFDGTVFGKMPASQMLTIRKDLGLLKAGKQPTGLAMGAILRGSDTGYHWGEPSSGGESLIPHGLDRRQRSLELWRATGRILGAMAPPSGGGSSVVISPGAVTVSMPITQPGATPAQIEGIAKRAVGEGMNQLVRQLNHNGRR
jgi:TP901 family phage tail tape measure protein